MLGCYNNCRNTCHARSELSVAEDRTVVGYVLRWVSATFRLCVWFFRGVAMMIRNPNQCLQCWSRVCPGSVCIAQRFSVMWHRLRDFEFDLRQHISVVPYRLGVEHIFCTKRATYILHRLAVLRFILNQVRWKCHAALILRQFHVKNASASGCMCV